MWGLGVRVAPAEAEQHSSRTRVWERARVSPPLGIPRGKSSHDSNSTYSTAEREGFFLLDGGKAAER